MVNLFFLAFSSSPLIVDWNKCQNVVACHSDDDDNDNDEHSQSPSKNINNDNKDNENKFHWRIVDATTIAIKRKKATIKLIIAMQLIYEYS